MSWTNELASRKPDNPLDDGYETPGFGEARLARLREVLKMDDWNFHPDSAGFYGFSEGICFLGGIDPEGSIDGQHFAPRFLPGAVEAYKVTDPVRVDEAGDLQEAIQERLDRLRGLRGRNGLKLDGLVHVAEAIEAAVLRKLDPPWLVIANEDRICAAQIPPELRTNDEVRRELKIVASSKGGKSRAGANKKTQVLEKECLPIFEELRAAGFKGHLCRNGRPNAASISDAIYQRLVNDGKTPDQVLPEIPSIARRVRSWMKSIK